MTWQRHFLAVLPDQGARDALAAVPLPPGARGVDPADLHVTLAFLGTLDAGAEAQVLALAARLAREPRLHGLVARLEAVEYWARPGILCAVAGGGPDPLLPLAEAIATGLQSAVPAAQRGDGRPFRSHVTLARRAPRGSHPPDVLAAPIAWPVRELVLMASQPGAEIRPRYVVRGACPFQYEEPS